MRHAGAVDRRTRGATRMKAERKDGERMSRPPTRVGAGVIGLAMVVAIAVGSPYTRYLLRNTPLTFTALPWGIVAMFALVGLVVNPLLTRLRPSWRITPQELGVAFIMGVMAAAVVGLGYVGTMLATISSPVYYATPENRWAVTFYAYLPKYLVPSDHANAVTWFYDGLPPGQPIPWGAWCVPVFWWTSFAGALMLLLYGLSVAFRRHWVEHERLPFPLNQVPLALAKQPEPGRRLPPMARGKAFWWGFAISCGWLLFNILHNFWPLMPRIPTEWPLLQFGKEFPTIPVKIFFPIIAVSYLAPKEVLFSMWGWMVLGVVYTGFARRLGVQASLADDSMTWLSTGAMVVVDELASSIIMHAYAPEVSDIYSVSLHFRDKGVEIVFNDKGKPYDPSKAFEATGSPGERTLSQKILQAFCDEIHYSYDSVTGNTLKVFKRHGDPKAKGRDRAGTVKSEA